MLDGGEMEHLSRELQQILETINIESLPELPSYKQLFSNLIQNRFEAFLYLIIDELKQYRENDIELMFLFAKEISLSANEELEDDYDKNIEILRHYTQQLLEKIAGAYEKELNHCLEMLNMAEQSLSILKKEQMVASPITLIKNNTGQWLLTTEDEIQFKEELKLELQLLKNKQEALNIQWFKSLNHEQQKFILNSTSIAACHVDLNDLLIAYDGVSKESYKDQMAYLKLVPEQKHIIDELIENCKYGNLKNVLLEFTNELINIPFNTKTENQLIALKENEEHIETIPHWFESMTDSEMALLLNMANNPTSIDSLVNNLTTKPRLRALYSPSNDRKITKFKNSDHQCAPSFFSFKRRDALKKGDDSNQVNTYLC